ncbi:MAG: IS1 family transposase [Chlorobi bacterium]|nr:IS1 family transposase [Chlorobiota bacterium]MCI0715032.1 IS1 family transposase [Chlorobiota bacterium]
MYIFVVNKSGIKECLDHSITPKITACYEQDSDSATKITHSKPKEKELTMNILPIYKQIQILNSLVEGNSIRSISRMLNVHAGAILRLLEIAGKKALDLHDRNVVNIKSNFIQIDEIWAYVQKKQKQIDLDQKWYGKSSDIGDQYTFVALDAETKLVTNYLTGKRSLENTYTFLRDLQQRVITRFQLTSDSFKPYYHAVRRIFGNQIDYAQLHKVYGEDYKEEKRYSPAEIKKTQIISLIGEPKLEHISTSYVERQNLTMRMNMRRFTRLTNAFSKKLDNLKYAVSLHFFHYNFMRIHKSLRATPAMVAGITNTIWDWEDFLGVEKERKMAV